MREIFTGIAFFLTLWAMYKLLFGDKDELIECIKFWFTPDIISMFRGTYWEDHWAEFKIFIWLGSAGVVAYGVYHI
ncbi:hypothetical protein [Zooshikella sp. RANM57]|uniref:hypothetical protein n=1 Tax=Zooshikella sp. RANM57 TaxID=3425863 RepID=UPI003D6FFE86